MCRSDVVCGGKGGRAGNRLRGSIDRRLARNRKLQAAFHKRLHPRKQLSKARPVIKRNKKTPGECMKENSVFHCAVEIWCRGGAWCVAVLMFSPFCGFFLLAWFSPGVAGRGPRRREGWSGRNLAGCRTSPVVGAAMHRFPERTLTMQEVRYVRGRRWNADIRRRKWFPRWLRKSTTGITRNIRTNSFQHVRCWISLNVNSVLEWGLKQNSRFSERIFFGMNTDSFFPFLKNESTILKIFQICALQ